MKQVKTFPLPLGSSPNGSAQFCTSFGGAAELSRCEQPKTALCHLGSRFSIQILPGSSPISCRNRGAFLSQLIALFDSIDILSGRVMNSISVSVTFTIGSGLVQGCSYESVQALINQQKVLNHLNIFFYSVEARVVNSMFAHYLIIEYPNEGF